MGQTWPAGALHSSALPHQPPALPALPPARVEPSDSSQGRLAVLASEAWVRVLAEPLPAPPAGQSQGAHRPGWAPCCPPLRPGSCPYSSPRSAVASPATWPAPGRRPHTAILAQGPQGLRCEELLLAGQEEVTPAWRPRLVPSVTVSSVLMATSDCQSDGAWWAHSSLPSKYVRLSWSTHTTRQPGDGCTLVMWFPWKRSWRVNQRPCPSPWQR